MSDPTPKRDRITAPRPLTSEEWERIIAALADPPRKAANFPAYRRGLALLQKGNNKPEHLGRLFGPLWNIAPEAINDALKKAGLPFHFELGVPNYQSRRDYLYAMRPLDGNKNRKG